MKMESDDYIDPDGLWEWLYTNLKEKINDFNQQSRTIQVKFYSRLFTFTVEPQELTPPMVAFITKSDNEIKVIPKGVLAYQYYLKNQRLVFVSTHGNKRVTIFFPIEDYYRTRVRGKQFRTWTNRMLNHLKEWEDKNREKKKIKKSSKQKSEKTRKIPPTRLDGFLQNLKKT